MLAVDESALQTTPLRKRSWAPRGATPVVTHPGSRKKLTAIAGVGLMPSGRAVETFKLYKTNATWEVFFWWLVAAHRHFGRKLIIVWDNLRAHYKAAAVMRQLELPWIEFVYLPAYAPELNPVEHLWCSAKHHALANWTPPNLDALGLRAERELSRHKHCWRFLQSYFACSKLSTGND